MMTLGRVIDIVVKVILLVCVVVLGMKRCSEPDGLWPSAADSGGVPVDVSYER